ncbi:MAG: glycosyl hydrolase 108 family protein [Methylocella sp.]
MASANFSPCLAFELRREGGKVDDPRDPGGRTDEGITQRTYNAWRKARRLPLRSVYLMAPSERDAIYRREYWDAIGGDDLRAGEDLVVLDYAVNSGPAKALSEWRAAGGAKADVDAVIRALCARRLTFLHRLSNWTRFGKGWDARVAACQALALQMAAKQRQLDSVARAVEAELSRSMLAAAPTMKGTQA